VSAVDLVAPGQWFDAVAALRAEGFTFFEWLGAVDEVGRPDGGPARLRVVVVLRHLARPAETRRLSTEVDREAPALASLTPLFAGASWHEREAAEMFGVVFDGGSARRLLLGPEFEGTPMRKDEVLGARAGVPWPGAKEPGESVAAPSRRRMVPPGVPDPEVWGERDPDAPPAEAAEVAESAVGGRVRRRRSR
jgi:NADH-quinone oxidoreductase subunit C